MNEEKITRLTQQLKLEVLDLLANSDLANDKQAQRTLLTINNTFARIEREVEEILPPIVLEAYLEGLAEAEGALVQYNIGDEQLELAFNNGASTVASGGALAGATEAQTTVLQATLQTQLHYEAVTEVTEHLMMDLKASIRTARMNANESIVEALAETQRNLQSGMIRGKARKAIQKNVMASFEKYGLTSFVCKDGRKLPLDFYSQVVTRTNLKRANVRGAVNRYSERNVKLYTVDGNYPTCGQCANYRGFVFSMDPESTDFPYLSTETFPVHPNCQCAIRPFVTKYKTEEELESAKRRARNFKPGKDYRTNKERRAYEEKQERNRQRNYEKKRYAEIKAIMGNEAPKTLGAFRRMKRQNTENYEALVYDFQETKKDLKEKGILT